MFVLMTGVAILSMARDVDRYLHRFIQVAKDIGERFGRYRLFICENDSTDGTRSILNDYASHDWVSVVSPGKLDARFKHKTHRLAYARQALLQTLIDSNFDPAVVLTIDVEAAALDMKTINEFITKASECADQWDGIFPLPNDGFKALRYGPYKKNLAELEARIKHGEGEAWMDSYVASVKENIHSRAQQGLLMPVFSCFSGVALYKYEIYVTGKYSGANVFFTTIRNRPARSVLAPEESEHVNMHRSLGSNVRLVVMPDVAYPMLLSWLTL